MTSSDDKMPWIGGLHAVLAALREGTPPVIRVLLAPGRRDRRVQEVIREVRRSGIPYTTAPRQALDRLSHGLRHQGVVAEVGEIPFADREEALAGASRPELLLLLDGIEDPHNLGAILRTAAAAGVGAVFLPRHRSAGLTPGTVRASAGTAARVPVVRERNLADLVHLLEERGISCWALDPLGGLAWDRADLTGPVALVAGGEGKGVRRLVRERCRGGLSLPLGGGVASLNVSVAVGAVLFEVIRQRRGGGGGVGNV